MADNNQNGNQDPFGHPIKRNNWWLYIFGGLCFAGLIAWFFIDWSYKDRKRAPEPEPMPTEEVVPATVEPEVTVSQVEDSQIVPETQTPDAE